MKQALRRITVAALLLLALTITSVHAAAVDENNAQNDVSVSTSPSSSGQHGVLTRTRTSSSLLDEDYQETTGGTISDDSSPKVTITATTSPTSKMQYHHNYHQVSNRGRLRGTRQRRSLAEGFDFGNIDDWMPDLGDMDVTEMGAFGILLLLVALILFLLCCCCRCRCSLWDLLLLYCCCQIFNTEGHDLMGGFTNMGDF